MDVRNLEPRLLWNAFADLNAVPRPSKKEEKVIAFIKSFGSSFNLKTYVDDIGNVIIRKPATAGMENRKTVVLQSHLDMVHQKNSNTEFDFDSQGIQMFVDGDWVKARGTTLGADNGIGVAAIMSVLQSHDIPHPEIEALFTIDEETGMTGAFGLKPGTLTGKILLNLDTENDEELMIGCAGGIDVTASGQYKQEKVPTGATAFKIVVKGLTGGHSGMDIILGRANANKLLNRILFHCRRHQILLSSFDGGGLRNAIPREATAVVAMPQGNQDFERDLQSLTEILKSEYSLTDPHLTVELSTAEIPENVVDQDFQTKFINTLYSVPNGIYRMSPGVPGLVQSSNNLARVELKNGDYTVQCLTRSSVDTEKEDVANAISGSFGQINADVKFNGSYPGWTPKPDSEIVKMMASLYEKKFQKKPHVTACHAGLECGILGKPYPEMEMISFGPNITGAHSPDERVQISSVQKFWGFLLDTLANIPEN